MIQKFIFCGVMLMTALANAVTAPSVVLVTMKSISFEPKILQIKTNQSVEWINKSYTDHSATSDDASFDTGLIHPEKKSKTVVFSKSGTFKYNCSVHGKAMKGEIIVTAEEKAH